MRSVIRLLLVGCLVFVLGLMSVHYAVAYSSHYPYPTVGELDDHYDQHIGERVQLFGTVERIDVNGATIRVGQGETTFEMRVQPFEAAVQPGGIVQVYGTLHPNHRLRAIRTVVVNPSERAQIYKYATSLVGALLVIALFFREWRIDVRALSIEART